MWCEKFIVLKISLLQFEENIYREKREDENFRSVCGKLSKENKILIK